MNTEYLSIAQALPQWPNVNPANFDRWLNAILVAGPSSLSPARHLERMAGLTGTQTPVIVQEKRGMRDPFGESIRSIVEEKLFLGFPKKQTAAMGRGIQWEPYIQDMFRLETGAVTDENALTLARNTKGFPSYPWLIGTPDDVVSIDGKKYVVDYKSPFDTHTVFKNGKAIPEVLFRYVCQVHQYKLILGFLGIQIDGMLVVFPDMKRNKLIIHPVEEDPTVSRDILAYGSEVWDQVLAGTIPDGAKKKNIIDTRSSESIASIAEKYVFMKKINSLVFDCVNSLKDEISSKVLSAGVIEGKVGFDGAVSPLSVSVKPSFDEIKLADYFASIGMELPLVPGKKLRTIRMAAELAYAGTDPALIESMTEEQLFDAISSIGLNPNNYREMEIDTDKIISILLDGFVDPSSFAEFSLTLRNSSSGAGKEKASNMQGWAESVFTVIEREFNGGVEVLESLHEGSDLVESVEF